jgi:hypothetical protein
MKVEERGKGAQAHRKFACVLREVGGGPGRPDFAGNQI